MTRFRTATRTAVSIACLIGWLAAGASAQTSYPMLMSLHPVAARTGHASEHTIESRYSMFGAGEVIVTGAGVTGEIIHPEVKPGADPPKLQQIKIRFDVAPDALPGVRDFRIHTPRGASTLGQLVIARDEVVVEAKQNSPDEPQPAAAPGTWCGVIEKAEDVDSYRFSAEAGQSLSFHVRSMRLQNRIHDLQQHSDPIVTLRNAAGSTLATSDNYFFGDPFLAHTFQEAGEYTLEIRDVRYQGNKYWVYSIEVSSRPFVTNAHPLAVRRGEEAELELTGANMPEDRRAKAAVSDSLAPGARRLAIPFAGDQVVAPLVVTELPVAVEQPEANNTPEQCGQVALPTMICGRVESEADIDCYRFDAKKGQRWSFQVLARRSGSSLDSHLRILDSGGKQLAVNDDLRLGKRNHSDSWVENWTAPADGQYVIELRDLHLRGGETFLYAIEATAAEPTFELYVDTDKTLLTPGTSGVIFVRAVRKNGFDGPVELTAAGLPEGVTASCGRILDGKGQDGCIVLTAAPNAESTMGNIDIGGFADWTDGDGKQWQLRADAAPYQETYQPGGGRGHYPAPMHTVSVGAPGDIRAVRLDSYDVTLKQGEAQQIGVEIERAEGFDKNVSLDVIYKHLNSVYGDSLPTGVTIDGPNSKILLTKGAAEGHITLKAAPDAALAERQQAAVMANISLNFVMKATYCSEPLRVTVVAGEETEKK